MVLNTIPMMFRISLVSPSKVKSADLQTPLSYSSSVHRMLMVVDFPAPFGPRNEKAVPFPHKADVLHRGHSAVAFGEVLNLNDVAQSYPLSQVMIYGEGGVSTRAGATAH
jgi:hypothetical protein